jgi:ATP-dependent DNA helicase RecQ
LIKEWNAQPQPTLVTCIPSRRHLELVPDFAQRLAEKLGLPFRDVFEKIGDRPEQKTMANSQQQAVNIDGSLKVRDGIVLNEPVFLCDDMVDSRWTMTIAVYLLKSGGAGKVFPLALADTGNK